MILSFFIGGSLFTIIELVVNRFDNTALGALISMIPIGFLTTFIIKKSNILNYVRNIFFVVCLNLLCSVIFYIGLKFLPLDKNIVIQVENSITCNLYKNVIEPTLISNKKIDCNNSSKKKIEVSLETRNFPIFNNLFFILLFVLIFFKLPKQFRDKTVAPD